MTRPDVISVQRTIPAPPEVIWPYLADAGRHVEIDGSGTVRGTRQPSRPLELGTTFGMQMHLGVGYRTSNEVVEFEPNRRIAWRTTGLKGLVGGRVWRYELVPVEGGTVVTESWDVSRDRQKFFLKRSAMAPAAEAGMRKTLERLNGLVAQQ